MSVVACPSCGSGSHPGATQCWLCGFPFAAAEAAPVAPVTAVPPQKGVGWLVAVILATVVLLGVAIELAFFWPGLLIPFAVVLVPVLFVLGRIVYVQRIDFWKGRAETPPPVAAGPIPAEGARLAPPGGALGPSNLGPRGDAVPAPPTDVAGKVVTGIAMGLLGVAVIVGVLILLSIAAFIVLMVICFAAMASGGP